MRVPGARKARLAVGRLRQRFEQAPVILLYHRVARLERDPWEIAVTPRHFDEHLQVLRSGYRSMSLTELVERQQRRSLPRRAVVLTFDDGYADNLSHARPLLERHRCPATFFVATGCLAGGREFWWDELERLLFESNGLPDELRLEAGGVAFEWSSRAAARGGAAGDPGRERRRLFHSLYRRLRPLPERRQQELLGQLGRALGVEAAVRPSHRTMTPDDVASLARDPLIEVGSHTVTHPVLGDQPESVQRHEIEESKRILEELLGHPVSGFSYPHGGVRDFDAGSVELVRRAGYRVACAAYRGVVRERTDRFRLPRLSVSDCDGETFARGLARLFG